MTRRLYVRIYLAFVAILAAFFLLSAVLWWHGPRGPGDRESLDGAAGLAQAALPPADADPAALERSLANLAERLGASLAIFTAAGAPLAAAGDALPAPDPTRDTHYWVRRRGRPTLALHLDDGRWVMLRLQRGPHGFAWLGGLALLAALIAVAAYPVARGITRRLEKLEAGVESLGAGDLDARVPVTGDDEVARLARRFNRAAERIRDLVGSQRALLASASHELRSPLARIRVAAELLGEKGDPALRDQLARDIDELDAGVEELLVVSRLGLLDATEPYEEIDLLALVAEEAARTGAEVRGEPVSLRGDRRSLRHLVRNLLRNAANHAPGEPAQARVEPCEGGGAWLHVEDRGPGIPEDERERVFEPFTRGSLSARGGGLGLGLAIVRQIAHHHRGEAHCEARDGGGTRMSVRLPGR